MTHATPADENDLLRARIAILERDLEVYRCAFESSPIGITITSRDGTFLDANPSALLLFGRQRAEVIGLTPTELGLLDPPPRAGARQREQPGPRGGVVAGETRLIRRDGQAIWVKLDSSPMLDEAGEPAGSVSAMVDITERRLAEERLRESEERLVEAQALAHVGSWEWDLRADVVTRSAELSRMLGYPPDPLGTGETARFEHVHPDDRERVRADLHDAITTRDSYEMSYRLLGPDGVRIIHSHGRIVRDEAGAAERLLGTSHDVTERKQLEARLTLTDRMASIGTLAAGVAHEINNPLAYILSNLELAAEEIREITGGSPTGRLRDLATLVEDARHGGERVRKIVRGLKAFSRADDEEHRAVLDVPQVLDVAASMANNEIVHRARLVKDFGPVPRVEADEARLGQVFVNLLVNAAQAIPEGRAEANEIRLSTRTDESGSAVIEVRDTGPGMTPEVQARAFDPFFTTKPVGVGTGLGLSICHGIIAALGGTITVESEPGRGTVLRVVLPASSAPAATEPTAKMPVAATAMKRGRVLVVDDDAMVGKTLSRILKGHDVTVLTDAHEASARIASGERFDVIFCDLMMPEMTGMDLHAELARTNPELASRTIFITGGAFTPAAMDFLDRVDNERIEKPFDAESVRSLVQKQLR
jgi:PAS domain S-box-containing protein